MSKLVDEFQTLYQTSNEIAAAAEQEARGVQEINSAIAQLDRITQQNSAMVVDTEAVAVRLARHSEQAHAELAAFVLGPAREISLAMSAM